MTEPVPITAITDEALVRALDDLRARAVAGDLRGVAVAGVLRGGEILTIHSRGSASLSELLGATAYLQHRIAARFEVQEE